MNARSDAPLIVTLKFDGESFAIFDEARRRHFPSARNHIPAHLTLFHHLPGTESNDFALTLREVASRTSAFPLAVTGLRFLGYGCAFAVESAPLTNLRRDLAARWQPWLTPQDAAPFKPHVTIQNKAPAAEAKRLFAELQAGFRPFEATGTGLLLWHYRGGPWEAAGEFAFASEEFNPSAGPPPLSQVREAGSASLRTGRPSGGRRPAGSSGTW